MVWCEPIQLAHLNEVGVNTTTIIELGILVMHIWNLVKWYDSWMLLGAHKFLVLLLLVLWPPLLCCDNLCI